MIKFLYYHWLVKRAERLHRKMSKLQLKIKQRKLKYQARADKAREKLNLIRDV